MSFEQPKEESPRERTVEELRLHNSIQIELMKRWAVRRGLSDHDAAIEWTEGKHFSGNFSEIVKEHPGLYGEYKEDPEGTLGKIEDVLYSGEELKNAA